jgi:hypothetical protein
MTSAARERLYDRELAKAQAAGFRYPVCNLCGIEIRPGSVWHESHVGRPKALGGKESGLAHRECNIEFNRLFDTPRIAKAKRQARKHKGCIQTSAPLPFGRATNRSKKLNGEVVPRMTQGEKLRQTLAKRRIGP